MNCARCIHYAVCPYDAIVHDKTRWETKKCVHFVDESKVKKVVRGEWIDVGDFEQCSACRYVHLKEFMSFYGKGLWISSDFCPHCGADMR